MDELAMRTADVPETNNRYWVLFAVCVSGLILPLEYTAPAMALPAIERALGGSPIALSWVINAFALAFGSSVMAAGALADQYGRKRMFALGISSFTVLSLAIGLSPNVVILDLIRGAQGIAAALTMAGGAAALAQEFEGRARTKAFSLLGTSFGIGLASGPVIAGTLVETLGWRSIFLLGAAVGVLVLTFGVARLRESRDPGARRLDLWGVLSFTGFLLFLTFAIMQIPQSGMGSGIVVGLLCAAILTLAIFVVIETAHERPMLDLSLFRYPRFVGVQFLPIATGLCFIVLLILLPIRLVGGEGMSSAHAGAIMIALSAPMAVIPFVAALLTRWISAPMLSCGGLLLAAAGIGLLAETPVDPGGTNLLLPLLVIGIGTGLPWGLMDDLSVSVVPTERAGMATGIFTTTRACGEAICVAASLALLNSFLFTKLSNIAQRSVLSAEDLREAANTMITGGVDRAALLAEHVGIDQRKEIYGHAFVELLHVLMAVTILSALASGLALRSSRAKPGCPRH